MNKILTWLKASNRLKHLAGGTAIGMLSDTAWCALLAGGSSAAALELKDRQWGGRWDWTDFAFTLVGTAAGFVIRTAIIKLIN